jgi:hypothetical protein
MRTTTLTFFILFFLTNLFGQNKYSYIEKNKDSIDFCKPNNNLIGKKLKIYHNGGIYSTANEKGSKFINWKNEEIRIKAGKSHWGNYEPKTGEIGEVIQIENTKYNEIVYILKVGTYYIPIKCSYLTQENNLSSDDQYNESWKEIENYGLGDCNFKKNGFNGVSNRAGIAEIDKQAENFACNLKARGIETIMLVKRISDNGSSPNEIEYIFWVEDNQGYKTSFKNNQNHKPKQTEVERYEWNDILDYYNKNVKNTEIIFPGYHVSHWTNLIVQLYQKEDFYSFGMQLFIKKEDEKLSHVKFIRFVEKKLAEE